jgi:Leucine-rich repeat (LRR) protein
MSLCLICTPVTGAPGAMTEQGFITNCYCRRYADKVTSVDLSYKEKIDPSALKQFTKINEFNLRNSGFNNFATLYHFPLLKTLDLGDNELRTLNGIEKLIALEKINLSGNPIDDYSPLYELKNLKEIHIDGRMTRIDSLEMRKHLPHVIINY